MDKFEKLKEEFGKECKLNVPLSKYNTLQIGGPADAFLEVKKEADLIAAFKLAKKIGIKCLILGGGSNLLINDNGFRGLIIHNKIVGIQIKDWVIKVKSGTCLQDLVDFSIKKGLQGIENLSGIPGTVGGAVFGNAGAYGQEISDDLIKVKIFDGKGVKWLKKSECRFGYRESIFKNINLPILEVEFKLKKGDKEELNKKTKEILNLRIKKYPSNQKSPGSFFKNISVKDLSRDVLQKIPKEKIIFNKISAGYLLEAVGAKGKRRGQIEIADYHANLFINKDGGKATDFIKLTKIFSDKVKKKFGIKLEPEVQLVGFK